MVRKGGQSLGLDIRDKLARYGYLYATPPSRMIPSYLIVKLPHTSVRYKTDISKLTVNHSHYAYSLHTTDTSVWPYTIS